MKNVFRLIATIAFALIVAGGAFAQSGANPFIGTWYSTNSAGLTLEFTATNATLSNASASTSGPYTRNGNTVTLSDTSGSPGVCVISGNTLTLTWNGVSYTFSQTRPGGNTANQFIGTWRGSGLTMVFTATAVTMTSATGTGTGLYTLSGATATIRGLGSDSATAVIAGNNLTLTWQGRTFYLTK